MRYLGTGILILLALVVGALFFAPAFIPADVIKEQIETNASAALGRSVTVAGEPSISFLPPKASVSGLTVANAEGFSAPHLLRVEEADVGLKLMPLFGGKAEITRFELVRPDIRLESNAAGEANWILGPEDDGEDDGENEPKPADEEPSAGGTGPITDLKLGDVRIVDGTVVLSLPDTEPYRAENANIVLGLNSLDDPLTLDGTLTLQDEPSTLSATFSTPRQFAENSSANMTLTMAVGDNRVDTDISLKEGLSFDGNVDVDFPALRAFLALAGTPIDTPNGFQRLRLKGPLSGNAERLSFGDGTELRFDAIEGTGAVTLDLAGARPKISGNIAAQNLDLNAYLPEQPEAVQNARAAQARGEKPAFPPWSTEPMDFSALNTLDTDLKVSTQQLLVPSLTVGPSAVHLKVDRGRAVIDLSKMTLYEGQGSGTVVVNSRGARPSMSAKVNMTGVNVGAFAADFMGLTRLQGRGDVTMNVTTAGRSQADLVRGLNGTTKAALNDGKIEGVNLGQLARGVSNAYAQVREGGLNAVTVAQSLSRLSAAANGPAESTDFSALNVDVRINDGVVRSNTISLIGPYFDIQGDALVNLPDQTMRMTLTPSVSEIEGEEKRSLPVPILVSGSFNEPKIGVDADAVVRGAAQNALGDVLRKQGINVAPEQSVEDALRGRAREELGKLLNPSRDEEEEKEEAANTDGETAEEADPTQQLIEQGLGSIFGRKDDQ